MGPALIDAAEVARLLGVSRGMVYDLAAAGRLSCYRYSVRAVRFDLADVEAFRHASRVEASRAPASKPPTASVAAKDSGVGLVALFAACGVKPRGRPPGSK